MINKEEFINLLKNKSKTQIAKELNITRKKVSIIEKQLGIEKEDYIPIYRNKEKLLELIELYETPGAVAKHLGINRTTITEWYNRFGLDLETRRTLKLNENYFDEIDTEHKAYWLGFIMADGCMDKTCTKLTLNISKNDEHILNVFKKDINSSATIKYSENNGFIYSRILLCSLKMCKSLIYHGITPRKTGREILPDTIPEELIRHFIRGYMDGDGSVVTYEKCNSAIRLDFASTSYNIFYSIHEHLIKNNIIDSKIIIKQELKSKCRHLNYHSLNAVKVLDYLYKDSTIYLERKYNKYKEKFRLIEI